MTRFARLLLHGGVIGAVLALGKLHAVQNEYDFTGSSRFAWSFGYAALLVLALYGAGLPDLVRTRVGALGAAASAATVSALAISVIQLATGDALLPRFVVFGTAAVVIPLSLMVGDIARRGREAATGRDRVLVVGSEVDRLSLEADLDKRPERHAVLLDVLPCDQVRGNGTEHPLVEAAETARASVIVLARDAQVDDLIVLQAEQLHESGIRVRTLIRFYEEWLGKLPVSELERLSLMFDISELHRERYGRIKRLLDLVVALPGTVVLTLAVPIVIAGNIVANRGPLFYRQARVGRDGVVFQTIKFRTMRPTPEGAPNEWTSEDDPRITPFGRLMRVSHVDELPQMLDILRGRLSIVGPRPEQPHYVERLVEKLPFYHLRHLVTPGLTGWAQVKYGYAGTERDALEKLQYEFYYLRHQGLTLELRVIGRTLRSVFGLRGR